jgi:hypothetical protein
MRPEVRMDDAWGRAGLQEELLPLKPKSIAMLPMFSKYLVDQHIVGWNFNCRQIDVAAERAGRLTSRWSMA